MLLPYTPLADDRTIGDSTKSALSTSKPESSISIHSPSENISNLSCPCLRAGNTVSLSHNLTLQVSVANCDLYTDIHRPAIVILLKHSILQRSRMSFWNFRHAFLNILTSISQYLYISSFILNSLSLLSSYHLMTSERAFELILSTS